MDTVDDPGGMDDTMRAYRAAAGRLVRQRSTLVLATGKDDGSWCAPVYYVYMPPGFYFYSSPNARHIQQGLKQNRCASAVFADGTQWQEIQGLQMSGSLNEVNNKREQVKAAARYLAKFPFAGQFILAHRTDAPGLLKSIRMYCFRPMEAYFTNNRLEFGKRVLVDLS